MGNNRNESHLKRVGIIGLGDMGIGLSRNLIKAGFELTGFDLREVRLTLLQEADGKRATGVAEVGANSNTVFVMVLNGKQAREVLAGDGGLSSSLKPGSTVIISATIEPSEVREIEQLLAGTEIALIDSPVSGGKSGADAGTLTLMTAAKQEDPRPVSQARYCSRCSRPAAPAVRCSKAVPS